MEPVKTFYELLNEILRTENLGPNRRYLDGGRRRLRWHVDNEDDRYVEMAFSEVDPRIVDLVLVQGQTRSDKRFEVIVRPSDFQSTIEDAMVWVYDSLLHLASVSFQKSSREEGERIRSERGGSWHLPRKARKE